MFNFQAGAGNSNKDMWLVATMPFVSGTTFSGDLLSVTGSAFDSNPFIPLNSSINVTKVGTMSAEFDARNSNRGTLTYSVNGSQVVKSIERNVFGAFRTQCELP
jgi:hypothetical protein